MARKPIPQFSVASLLIGGEMAGCIWALTAPLVLLRPFVRWYLRRKKRVA